MPPRAKTPEKLGRFVVGGNGRRSGLASTKAGPLEVRVLVLPKLWAKDLENAGSSHGPGYPKEPIRFSRSVTIIAREGQAFDITIDTDCNHSESLRKCFAQLVETGAEAAADRAALEAAPHNAEEGEDEAIARRLPLLDRGRGSKPSNKVASLPLCPVAGAATDSPADAFLDIVPHGDSAAVYVSDKKRFGKYWSAFQSLWLHSLEVRRIPAVTVAELGQMSANDVASLDLRLLVHIAFVSKVAELLRHARPGYVRVTKPGQFVRGRMNPVSAAIVLAGGATTVECTYDEFGLDTPLHRVIVTALEEVCDSHQADGWLSEVDGPISEAAWLRRQFEAVRTLPRSAALRVGTGLQSRMSKLDGDWANALDLACLVLDDRSLSPEPGSRSTALSWGDRDNKAFLFDISTESMWEHLVRKYFRCERPEGKYSWEQLGKTKAPDGDDPSRRIIFDAKYKVLTRGKTPATGDTHQSFVYSHLFDSQRALLIYPVSDPTDETSGVPAGYKRHKKVGDTIECTLAVIRLAFPTMDDVLQAGKWRRFLDMRRKNIETLLGAP